MTKQPKVKPDSLTPDDNGVCAVVVTYNPTSRLIENLNALVRQVREVAVVDNGSNAEGQRILIEALKLGRVSVLYNSENMGIAAALNRGVTYARDHGFYWVATFDQDSTASESLIHNMLSAWNGCPFRSEVPLIAPRYQDSNTGVISGYAKDSTAPYAEITTTITSGNLVQTKIFDKVGLFAEDFFMDYVDHEFCLRLRSKGCRLIEVWDAVLMHSLGNMTQHRVFGKTFKTFNHTPLRRYYATRNRIIVCRRYGLKFPRWLLKDLGNFFRELAGIVLFETKAGAKIAAVIRGMSDGLLGKTGKYGGRL